MLGTLSLFDLSFANIITITFSALVYVELLNIHSTLTKNNWLISGAACFTVMIYIATIALLPNLFDVSFITWATVLKVLAIVGISWFPLYIIQKLQKKFYPTEH